MKGTVYGNRLSRGTQVKKGWEPLVWGPPRSQTVDSVVCVYTLYLVETYCTFLCADVA
jgi:hypothetical protein